MARKPLERRPDSIHVWDLCEVCYCADDNTYSDECECCRGYVPVMCECGRGQVWLSDGVCVDCTSDADGEDETCDDCGAVLADDRGWEHYCDRCGDQRYDYERAAYAELMADCDRDRA